MYTSYFGLSESPFSIAPNPHFLFMSVRHREALAHLTYGLGGTGGFVLLTGEVGTGKTTLSRCLLDNLSENTQSALILNPTLSREELLATICDKLFIHYSKTGETLKTLTDRIHEKLLKNHNDDLNTILIIDEAQHLAAEVLEQLRLLTNLETDTKKLLQVILIGQPELQQLLQRHDLRQLAQRITARYHLLPLNKQEVEQYIKHRLSVAQCQRNLFNKSAISLIHRLSQGIPRLINLLCDRALINAFSTNNTVVDKSIVIKSSQQALGQEYQLTPWFLTPSVKVTFSLVSLVTVLLIGLYLGGNAFSISETNSKNSLNDISAKSLEKIQNNNVFNVTDSESLPAQAVQNIETIADSYNRYNSSANEENAVSTAANLKTKDLKLTFLKEAPFKEGQIEPSQQKSENLTSHTIKYGESLFSISLALKVAPAVLIQLNNLKPPYNIAFGEVLLVPTSTLNAEIAQPEQSNKLALQEKGELSVYQAEGISGDLLERFQQAIDETSNDITDDIKSDENSQASLNNIQPLHAMPSWVQNGVGRLQFEMHIFASDHKGWVRVNGIDKYEGDAIHSDLMINEIKPQHVILSYKGEAFSLPALSSW